MKCRSVINIEQFGARMCARVALAGRVRRRNLEITSRCDGAENDKAST